MLNIKHNMFIILLSCSSCMSPSLAREPHPLFLELYPRLNDSDKIALGANHNVVIRVDDAEGRFFNPNSISSSDESIVRIQNNEEGVFAYAVGEGIATIEARGGKYREQFQGSFDIEVVKGTQLELKHHCTSAEKAAYLIGEKDIRISAFLKDEEGSLLFWGDDLPLEIEGEIKYRRGSRRFYELEFDVPEERQTYVFRSTIDDARIEVQSIQKKDIDDVRFAFGIQEVSVDRSIYVPLLASHASVDLCTRKDLNIARKSKTPKICRVSDTLDFRNIDALPTDNLNTFLEFRNNLFRVFALKEGTCVIEVSLPWARGGEGVVKTFGIPVIP